MQNILSQEKRGVQQKTQAQGPKGQRRVDNENDRDEELLAELKRKTKTTAIIETRKKRHPLDKEEFEVAHAQHSRAKRKFARRHHQFSNRREQRARIETRQAPMQIKIEHQWQKIKPDKKIKQGRQYNNLLTQQNKYNQIITCVLTEKVNST